MYTDEELEKLAEEENTLTEEAVATLLLTLGVTKNDLQKEIRNFYSIYGKDGVVTYQEARKWISSKKHTRRLFKLNQIIAATLSDSFDKFELIFKNHLLEIILNEAEFFGVTVDADKILETPWGAEGLVWKQRLWAHKNKWVSVIGNDLKISFLKKEDIADVLNKLIDRFGSMDKILDRLVVTESTATRSLARKEIFNKLGIKNYRFYTEADERTCTTCGALHGNIFPITAYEVGFTASPLHPRCRCWEVPIRD